MSRAVIQLRNVEKQFFDGITWRKVLSDINLDIFTQEFTIIAGPSGSGKTTLLTIVGLILTPSEGRIVINDIDATDLSEDDLASMRMRNLGFVFQHADLIPALTVLDNILIPTAIQGGRISKTNRKKALDMLDGFGLISYSSAMPQQISTGQRQRVAILRSMINDPVVLLCDEPTSALDVESSKIVLDSLKTLSQDKNRGVVMVTHDPRVFPYADRMIKLEDGKVVYDSHVAGEENDENKG
jgi:putative ABC transport system ATP-binding protein